MTETAAPVLSGFCSTPPGITRHDYSHEACEQFQKLDVVKRCDCPDHQTKETPTDGP